MGAIPPSRYFPPAEEADSDGLLALGGQLTPSWLIDAYTHGIFPWPFTDDSGPMAWWSPDPRAVLEFERLHVSRRLRRTCNSGRFTVTFNRAFPRVIAECAVGPGRESGTWLTPKMIAAYTELHELGVAQSVETWCEGRLAGGVYGVALGGFFAAESMFYRVRDGSKVALVSLVEHLAIQGFALLDIQQLTPHTERFGAREISRREFLDRLADAVSIETAF